jgi:selenide,water dikinase
MGGTPLTAMNIVCFPVKDMPKEILKQILQGGLEKIQESGAVLAGGHSVDDQELKYGLAVTGIVHPDKILTNRGAKVGDKLILTKPLGTGIIATAVKGKLSSQSAVDTLVDVTSALNDKSSQIMLEYETHACTDITGFGLGGHLLEMAKASRVEIVVHSEKIPIIPEVREYASMGLIPAGSYATRRFCEDVVTIESQVQRVLTDVIFDPQTSGGLIIAIAPHHAAECLKELNDAGVSSAEIIGEVTAKHPNGRLKVT